MERRTWLAGAGRQPGGRTDGECSVAGRGTGVDGNLSYISRCLVGRILNVSITSDGGLGSG